MINPFRNWRFDEWLVAILVIFGMGVLSTALFVSINSINREAVQNREFMQWCAAQHGHIVDIYRRPDLCVSEDGRVLNPR